MSQAAFAEFEKVRQQMLDEARICATCGRDCGDADHLVLHIWDNHKPAPSQEIYNQLQARISAKQRK